MLSICWCFSTSFATGKRESWVVSGRIRCSEKESALGGGSLYRVVPAPRPPARGVKRARVVSAFFSSRERTIGNVEGAFTVCGDCYTYDLVIENSSRAIESTDNHW